MIVQYPPTKPLTSEEGDLVWKFRFYLSNQKKVKAAVVPETKKKRKFAFAGRLALCVSTKGSLCRT